MDNPNKAPIADSYSTNTLHSYMLILGTVVTGESLDSVFQESIASEASVW